MRNNRAAKGKMKRSREDWILDTVIYVLAFVILFVTVYPFYFVLMLSFIPWMLLCTVTCGIAMLYVGPYMNATFVNFYEAIKPPVVMNTGGDYANTYYQA